MHFSRRQKVVIAALALYWPGIFIGTHIPLPQVPQWVGQVPLSDKTLHFIAYLFLSFLFWFAIKPDQKVSWRRATVWWVLLVVASYGAIDEWLQAYVGRDPDVRDFVADLAGAVTGLVALSIFNFWPACLVLTGTGMFVVTNFFKALPENLPPGLEPIFYLLAYAFFTLLWIRYIHHFLPVRPPQRRWLFGAMALPAALLAAFELFGIFAGNGSRPQNIIASAMGIILVAVATFVVAATAKRPKRKASRTGFERSI